jgi:hypothetical protein
MSRGVARSGRVVQPPLATKSKGWPNEYFKKPRTNKIQQMMAIFIKAIIFVRRGHCDYSPHEPEHLATPLGMPEAKSCPTWDLSNWHYIIKTLRW